MQDRTGRIGILLALAAAAVLPWMIGGQWVKILTSTACFALAIAGVAFLYARLGMVNLAQIALVGVGGWVTLRLNHGFALPFEANLLAGGLVAMLLGMALAIPALRMRGLYLALVTLMAAGALEIVFGTYGFPNGGDGFWGVRTSFSAEFRRPVIAQSDGAYLSYTILAALLGFLLIAAHLRAAPGRAWAMIRRSEAAALATGVNVTLYKTWAFAISGFLGGIAGGLLAGSLGLLDSGSFRASEGILLFALAVVGGARSWLGAIVAAALYRILPAVLNDWGVDADVALVLFGAGLLHAVITAPDGLAGQVLAALPRRRKRSVRTASAPDRVDMRNVSVAFGGVTALNDVSAEITTAVTGIIGPNGAGKTTLLNAFSGFVDATGDIRQGATVFTGMSPHARSRAGLRRSFQKEEIADDLSVEDNVLVQLETLGVAPEDRRAETARALAAVGLADQAARLGAELNAHERRLVEIARCMVGAARIILLDEPAAGLSNAETEAIGDLVMRLPELTGARVLVIDHDVELIARVCEATMVLDFGRLIAFGPTAEVLADPKVKAAYLGTDGSVQ